VPASVEAVITCGCKSMLVSPICRNNFTFI
jgi:hypothetical protein